MPVVAEAVWEGRRLDLRHGDHAARRRVDPLGLVLKAGTWYLVARHRRQIKTYRMSRIHRAELRPESFVRPAHFDLAAFWSESSAAFDRSLLTYRCRVRLSPRAERQLPHVVPHDAVRRMLEDAAPPDAEGFRTVELLLESEDVATDQLTGLGDGVEVLAPEALRRRLYAVGMRMAMRNGC
nr:WYL domain-containing protein [Polyangium spumosum]